RGDLTAIANLLAERKNLDAQEAAGQLAVNMDYETVMRVFRTRAKEPFAFGVGPKPGKKPDGIEAMLANLEIKPSDDVDFEHMLQMGYRIQAVAEVVAHLAARGKGEGHLKRREIAWRFRSHSQDFISAARMRDATYLHGAARTLVQTCQQCHNL